jgi:osmotically-inducible protein OsmY
MVSRTVVMKASAASSETTLVDRLKENQHTKDADIKVDVKQCVVILGGIVPSWLAKRAAGDDAWDTKGVVDVSNQLQIGDFADRP